MSFYFENIHLQNYKSHSDLAVEFDSKLNCICGPNGVGKTNLIDAIHYLSMTKSYFTSFDHQVIKTDATFLKIQGNMCLGDTQKHISYQWLPNSRKEVFINQVKQEKLSDIVGRFPVVMFTPYDTQMLFGGSEERRKFIDSTMCQLDTNYLEDIIRYNKILQQRNALLKNIENNTLLEVYNQSIIPLAQRIFEQRKIFAEKLNTYFIKFYYQIGIETEEVAMQYTSELQEHTMQELLEKTAEKEKIMGRTLVGIHHDDLNFSIKKLSLKKAGSQGQQKSFLAALKLSQYALLKDKKKISPILLFDDIFDKFDNTRVKNILNILQQESFGQLFITDTDINRMQNILGDDFTSAKKIIF
jgi:DNA replication and repair protein RecF